MNNENNCKITLNEVKESKDLYLKYLLKQTTREEERFMLDSLIRNVNSFKANLRENNIMLIKVEDN